MAHALARRRRDPGNKADHRFFHMLFGPARCVFFIGPADFADHDHRFGRRIVIEQFQHIDVLESVHRIAADAHGGRLSEADLGELADRFVSQCAGTRHHADIAFAMNMPRHDADLDFVWSDRARTVRTQQQGFAFLLAHAIAHLNHVAHRNAFGDADHQIQIRLDRLPDRRRRAGRRHVNDRSIGSGLLFRFAYRGKNRNALEILPGFGRMHTGDKTIFAIGVVAAGASVKLTGLSGNALGNDFGVLVDEYGHQRFPPAAATTFSAASAMLFA